MKRIILGLIFAFGLVAPSVAQTVANGPYYAYPAWDQSLPAAQRFIVLSNFGNAAVLDRETGLVWERQPDPTIVALLTATTICVTKIVGGKRGWRVPSIQELLSLSGEGTPFRASLPAGHPFVLSVDSYWSSTLSDLSATHDSGANVAAWVTSIGASTATRAVKSAAFGAAWCVRGGEAAPNQ